MKAIITKRDRNSVGVGRLGLRLVSEGAHDVVLMEMLEEDYPAIRRSEIERGTTMDVPLMDADVYPSPPDGVGVVMDSVDADVFGVCHKCLPGQWIRTSERSSGHFIIREPVVVFDDPASWTLDAVHVNGRRQNTGLVVNGDRADGIEDVPPGALVEVTAKYTGTDPDGAVLRCRIVPSSALPRPVARTVKSHIYCGTRNNVATGEEVGFWFGWGSCQLDECRLHVETTPASAGDIQASFSMVLYVNDALVPVTVDHYERDSSGVPRWVGTHGAAYGAPPVTIRPGDSVRVVGSCLGPSCTDVWLKVVGYADDADDAARRIGLVDESAPMASPDVHAILQVGTGVHLLRDLLQLANCDPGLMSYLSLSSVNSGVSVVGFHAGESMQEYGRLALRPGATATMTHASDGDCFSSAGLTFDNSGPGFACVFVRFSPAPRGTAQRGARLVSVTTTEV